LAAFFSGNSYVIAAGILPMAYGDAAASLAGQRFGRHKFSVFGTKSLEGSAAMFAVSIFGLLALFLFFSHLYSISASTWALASIGATAVATVCEAFTPKGFDNLTVPLFSAVIFLLLMGGV
jgi:dolichol kinase